MSTCSVIGCGITATGRGYCPKHYMRWYKHGDPNFVFRIRGEPDVDLVCHMCRVSFKRTSACVRKLKSKSSFCSMKCRAASITTDVVANFWVKVSVGGDEECWEWQAGKDKDGYGIYSHVSLGGPVRATRFSYSLAHPSFVLSDKRLVCHSCDNPPCVNPAHLWVGSNTDNQADMAAKRRHGSRPCNRGTKNVKSKLNEVDVLFIRHRANGGESNSALAKEAGIAHQNIHSIVNHMIWKHVPREATLGTILSDRRIRKLAEAGMIEPFLSKQVSEINGKRVLSAGISSFGYDLRVADEYKVFTNVHCGIVDPKNLSEESFVDVSGKGFCMIPPNSFALARSVEKFRIPRNILTLCVGKSSYARVGIVVNVTPFEPMWDGFPTLEISNTTPLPAKIYSNEGLAQVLFFEADEDCETSYADRKGKYQAQPAQIVLPKV